MRYSLLNTVTVALLGLGSVLTGTNGAPTSLARGRDLSEAVGHYHLPYEVPGTLIGRGLVGGSKGPAKGPKDTPDVPAGGNKDPSSGPSPGSFIGIGDSVPSTGQTYTPKPVPNIDQAYTVEKLSFPDRQWGDSYYVKDNVKGGMVNSIAINKKNEVTVRDADNKADPTPQGQKLYLSDVEMALFVREGRKPSDLTGIRFASVVEKSMVPIIDRAYATMGKSTKPSDGPRETIQLRPGSTGNEKTAYDELAASTFGKNPERVNQEFSVGKKISYIELSEGPNMFVKLD